MKAEASIFILLFIFMLAVIFAGCSTSDSEPDAGRSGDDDTSDDDNVPDDDDDNDDDNIDDDDDDDNCDKGCLIDDVCYPDGVHNPANECQKCEIASSNSAWTDDEDGAACDDGEFCNGADTCQDGACSVHTGDPCLDDGIYCNGEEYCNDNRCSVRNVPSCPDDGEFCNGEEYCDEDQEACASTGDPCEELNGLCLEDEAACERGEFESIPKGQFVMGSPPEQLGHGYNETQHNVSLTHDFEMMSTEVTHRLFEALMGYSPGKDDPREADLAGIDDFPAQLVSWQEALAFSNALSTYFGLPECFECSGSAPNFNCELKAEYATIYDCTGYRLPTESEWEYAARAGTTTALYNGDITYLACNLDPNLDEIGWYCGNSGGLPALVGKKTPNNWGLYDMCGNAWEWVWDWYAEDYPGDVTDPAGPETGTDRVIRSGSWYWYASYCLVASRDYGTPNCRWDDVGFRVARTLP